MYLTGLIGSEVICDCDLIAVYLVCSVHWFGYDVL